MATLTPEQKAKIDALMKKAELLYGAMLKTAKPTSLAFAVRDAVPFANLKDDAVEALAVTVSGYEKSLTELVAKLAEQPSPAAETAAAASPASPDPAPATEEKKPLVPEVLPPKSARREKTQGA